MKRLDFYNGIEAVVFDFDDTLCDYTTAHNEACQILNSILAEEICDVERYWKRYAEHAPQLFKLHNKGEVSFQEYWRRRHSDILLELGWESEQANLLASCLNQRYMDHVYRILKLFPDVICYIEKIRSLRIKIGILTNGSFEFQHEKISALNLYGMVDRVQISGEAGVSKPHPKAFRKMMSTLCIGRASSVLMIGDSLEMDVLGAADFGWRSVLLDRKGLFEDPGCLKIRSLDELSPSKG